MFDNAAHNIDPNRVLRTVKFCKELNFILIKLSPPPKKNSPRNPIADFRVTAKTPLIMPPND